MSLKNGMSWTPILSQQNRLNSRQSDKFPSSAAFDAISAAINASDADRKDAIKQGKGVYAFVLKNASGDEEKWHIDLKETGTVGTGTGKPDGMFYPRIKCAIR